MVADFNAGFPQEGVKVRYWFRERGGAGALGTAKLPAEMNGAQAIVYIFGAGSFPLSHVEVIE